MKSTYRKSWAGNLLIWTDLTLVPSFKVKQWLTSFGELSSQWIQIFIGFPMCRYSFSCILAHVIVIWSFPKQRQLEF